MAEDVRSTRQVSVTVCTSSPEHNVQALLNFLKGMTRGRTDRIKNVTYYKLPYNGIEKHKFTKEDHLDVMILCHSIQNRRFAITDVPDALYDKFLPNCQKSIGKDKIAVIAHDFEKMSNKEYSDRMSNFQQEQPTAFAQASLAMMCGKLGEGELLTKTFMDLIIDFLKKASHQPEEMKSLIASKMPSLRKKFTSGGSGSAHTTPAAHTGQPENAHLEDAGTRPTQERALAATHWTPTQSLLSSSNNQHRTASHPGRVVTSQTHHSAQQSPSHHNYPISVSICTSAFEHNVTGLISWLRKLKGDHPHLIGDVRLKELPYNDIDSFKFPSNDPVAVMVLCHSVSNRGFAITDVTNSIYDRYLKNCDDKIGKKKMAVIVHDITGWNRAVVPGKMETFQKTQPSTFKHVDTVIICGSLENQDKLEMREEDMGKLFSFFESASIEPQKKTSFWR